MMNKREILEELLVRELRKDFFKFVKFYDPDFMSGRESFLKEICDAFQTAYDLEPSAKDEKANEYNIAISLPPRSGKSYTTNLFTAWALGNDASRKVMRVSYSERLSNRLHEGVRSILQSPTYRRIFPLIIEKNNSTTIQFKGYQEESLYSTSVQGSSTGFGASYIILDDAYKGMIEALSESINEKTILWYENELSTRFQGSRQNFIYVGTRWRRGELVDKLEEEGLFHKVIRVKGMDEKGNSFNEEVISTEKLQRMAKNSPTVFQALYQQEPVLSSNGLLNADDLKIVEDYKTYSNICIIDGKTTGKDYFAVAMLSFTDKGLLLKDVIFTNDILDNKLEMRIINFINYYNPLFTFVEVNQDYSFYRNLNNRVNKKIIPFKSKINKEIRIQTNVRYLKDMNILSTDDREYNDFINQMLQYDLDNKNQHDDAIDSVINGVMQCNLYRKKINGSTEFFNSKEV